MPYSVRQQLEILQTSALRGAPLMNAKLQFIKSGKGLNTQYQVIPEMEPLTDFDLGGYLQTLGLQALPPLVGTENFPPIWSLDEEKLNNVAKGIMPCQGTGKSGPGTPAQNVEAYNPYGNPAPLTPAEPQAQATNVKQGEGHYAPTQAPAQATVPAQAPVLDAVPSDDLPQSFVPGPQINATAPAQPNVPYGSDGKQEPVKQTDDLEGKKVFF